MADSAPFTVFVGQPNTDAYDPHCEPDAQPRAAELDPTFVDAMKVRHRVFIQEQKVPLESEIDEDDPRSCHFVAHMSDGGDNTSALSRQPVGTIRVVPYPHAPHPIPGGAYCIVDSMFVFKGRWVRKAAAGRGGAGDDAPTASTPKEQLEFVPAPKAAANGAPPEAVAAVEDHATSLHDGKEPYVKLGRIAVLSHFRGYRLGQFLVQTALDWIQANPTYFDDTDAAAAAATAETKFKGLVCLHAQTYAIGFYTKLGFVVDEAMGTWWDEGMPHVGMFRRLDLAQKA